MFTQYFGNYLYEAGIISLKQFQEILLQMKGKRAKLGVLAIEAGFMTPAQVEETFSKQMQIDRKFGEIAIEKDYLTADQLEQLLVRQSSPFSVFSQMMIDSGYMTYSRLSEQLEAYKLKCGMSAEGFQKFQEGDISPVIDKMLSALTGDPQNEKIARSYIELFFRNVTRFINDTVTLSDNQKTPPVSDGWMACQQLSGTPNMTVSYTGSEDAMLYFAGRFAKADYTDFDLLARDVLGEFLNCTNGIFTGNALEFGVDLELSPQYVTDDLTSAQTEDMLCIHFSIENHEYQLNLAF